MCLHDRQYWRGRRLQSRRWRRYCAIQHRIADITSRTGLDKLQFMLGVVLEIGDRLGV